MRTRTLLDMLAVWGMRLAAVVVAPLLLFTARTWRGWVVGVWATAVWVFAACVGYLSVVPELVNPLPPPLVVLAFASVLFLVVSFGWGVLAAVFLLFTQPDYRSDTAGLRSVFLGPLFLHRLQLVLLSELDWLWLGTLLATRFDFRIGRDERRLIRDTIRLHLDELAESGEHRTVPPALPLAVWGRILRPDHGHLFVYRPEAAPGERLGLLVFLHGHGGNSLLYPHLLRPFADQFRCVLVCPSFGYGNWEHPHSTLCVDRAVRYALEHFPDIDPRRVFLAGLSQGGAGVGRAAVALPEVFAGLVFISATMEPAVLDNEVLTVKPVLVIHGDADRHVTLKSVEKGIDALRSAGADITVSRDPAGTHFLLFAQPDEVLRQVGEWIRQ
jgi:predicted esterase